MPSRDAARGRAHGRLGRALLLARGRGAAAGPRAAAALHLVGRVRRAARAAGRARPPARRRVPRARGREPARRPRGGRALRGRLLRQEHDADHAAPRLVGRARDARHDRRAGGDAAARRGLRLLHALHRRLPDRCARGGRRARRDALPLVLDAVGRPVAGGVPRGARRPRLRLRHLPGRVPVEPRRREAAGRGRRTQEQSRTSRSPTGSRPTTKSSPPATTGCSSRATTRASCGGTHSWRSATTAATRRWRSPLPRATTRCCASTPSGRWSGSGERRAAAAARRRALDRLGPARRRPARDLPGRDRPALPAALRALGVARDRDPRGRGAGHLRAQPARVVEDGAEADRARGAHLRLRDRLGLHVDLQLRAGLAHPAGDVPPARRGRAALRDRRRARPHRRERPGDGRLRMAALGSVRAAHATTSTTSRSSSGSRCCWA